MIFFDNPESELKFRKKKLSFLNKTQQEYSTYLFSITKNLNYY